MTTHYRLSGRPASTRMGVFRLILLALIIGGFCYVGGTLWWIGWFLAAAAVYIVASASRQPALFGIGGMGFGGLLMLHGVSWFPWPLTVFGCGFIWAVRLRFGARQRLPNFAPGPRRHREIYVSTPRYKSRPYKRYRIG